MAFFHQLAFFPTTAWGHFPNGAWGQEGIGIWKALHECSISKVCTYSCLFLLQERHQQGFARLFFTVWICNLLLDLLTLSETDHEAVLFKKKKKRKSLFYSASNHDIAAWHFRFSACRIILYKREKYILLYPWLFFNNILSIVASYLLPLSFILSFLATQKAGQRKKYFLYSDNILVFLFLCFLFVFHKIFVHVFVWRPLVL